MRKKSDANARQLSLPLPKTPVPIFIVGSECVYSTLRELRLMCGNLECPTKSKVIALVHPNDKADQDRLAAQQAPLLGWTIASGVWICAECKVAPL